MLLAVLIRLYVNLSNITISNDLVICQTYGYCFVQFAHHILNILSLLCLKYIERYKIYHGVKSSFHMALNYEMNCIAI